MSCVLLTQASWWVIWGRPTCKRFPGINRRLTKAGRPWSPFPVTVRSRTGAYFWWVPLKIITALRHHGTSPPDNYYSSHLGKLSLEPHLGETSEAFLSLSTLNRVSDTECHHKCMEVSSLRPTCFVCVLHPKRVMPSVTVLPSSSHGCGWPRLTAIASVGLGASWGSLAHNSLEDISYLALGILVKDLWLLGPVLSSHAGYLYTFLKNQLNLLVTYNVVGFYIGFFSIPKF